MNNERLVWTTKLVSCICDITKINPAYGNVNGWRVGRTFDWALQVSKSKPGAGVFHCIPEGNWLFSENFGCHFNFILHLLSDKAAFVRGVLLCVQRYRGNLALYSNSAFCWQRINLHIVYMPPQIVYICGTMV